MRGYLNDRGIKRIYILGAGFSCPLGMPLTSGVLKLTHDIAQTKSWDGQKHLSEWLLKKLCFYFPLEGFSHEKIQNGKVSKKFDIEKFISYVSAISAFGESFSKAGDDKFVSFLKGWIGEAIWRRQNECMKNIPKQYADFVNSLNNSLILTFNWDTVVETLLDNTSQAYDFGLESAHQKSGIPIIKLHGSIDWFLDPKTEDTSVKAEIIRKYDQSADLSKEESIHRVTKNLSYFYNESSPSPNYPLLVIPGYDKISQVTKLGNIWECVWGYLQDDLEIIIMGFSLRPDDYHSRAVIYPNLVYGSRKGYLKVKVVDFAQNEKDKKSIKERYKGVKNCQFWFNGFNEKVFEEFIN